MSGIDQAVGSGALEHDPPELMARNLRVAAHLWASATAFFFVAFLFAYFYLRALNQHGLWHPHGVKAPVALGTVITAVVVASALAAIAGARRLAAGDEKSWLGFGAATLALGVVAIVLQVVEWWTIGFGPTDGGFASVFLGWTGLYLLFLLSTLFWLETLLATTIRHRGSSHGPVDAGGADAFAFYWAVLAGIGVATWIVLYLV